MSSPRVRPPGHPPLVFAHRGASAHAPDNSLEAIAMARAAGADGVEIDVRFTSDRVMVLSHDDRIPGIGVIAGIEFADLRSDAPQVARLDEVLDVVGDMLVNIEIKNHPRDADFDPLHGQVPDVASWVNRRGLTDRAIVSSFNPETIGAFVHQEPAIATGLLLEHGVGFGENLSIAARAPHQWILPRHTALWLRGRSRLRLAHDVGLAVGTWTVDAARSLRRYGDLGVDLVMTNDPATARSVYG